MPTILDYMVNTDAQLAKNRMQNALAAAQKAKNPFIASLAQAQLQKEQEQIPYTHAMTAAQQIKNKFLAQMQQEQIASLKARVPLLSAQANKLQQDVAHPLLRAPGALGMLGAENYERALQQKASAAPQVVSPGINAPLQAQGSAAPLQAQGSAYPLQAQGLAPQPGGRKSLTPGEEANLISQMRMMSQNKAKAQTNYYKNRALQAGWGVLPEYQRDQVFSNLNSLGYPNSVISSMSPSEAQQKIVNQVPYSGSDAIKHISRNEEAFTRARLGNLMFDEPQRRQIRFAGEAKQTLGQVAPILSSLAPKLSGLSNFGRSSLTKAGLIGNTKDALAMNELQSRTGLLANEILQQLGGHATNEQREEFLSLVNPVKAGLDGKTYMKYYKDLWDYLDTIDRNIITKPTYSLVDMLTTQEKNPFETKTLQNKPQKDPLGLGL